MSEVRGEGVVAAATASGESAAATAAAVADAPVKAVEASEGAKRKADDSVAEPGLCAQ